MNVRPASTPAYGTLTTLRSPLTRLAQLAQTIRGRILTAFLAMSIITAALGGYAALGIRRAGILVTKTFDRSLMSISYARAASADFADMQVAFARRWSATKPETRAKLDQTISDLEENLTEDLQIARGTLAILTRGARRCGSAECR